MSPRLSATQNDRSGYLGASDIAVLAGVSRWQTPYELYLEKIGELDKAAADGPEVLARYERGHRLEALALEWWADEQGQRVQRLSRDFRHPRLPFVVVHPDAWVLPWSETRELVEAKTARARWDELPRYVEAQVQAQMAATGAVRVHVACLTWDGLDSYTVERQPELIAALEQLAGQFWQRVQDRNPPPVDGSRGAARHLDKLFTSEPEAEATPAQRALLAELLQVRATAGELEARERLLANQLKETMAGGSRLVAPGVGRVNWTAPSNRSSVAWKEVAQSYRAALEAVAGTDPYAAANALGVDIDALPPGRRIDLLDELAQERIDALETIHTTTAEGVRTFRLTPWKDKATDG